MPAWPGGPCPQCGVDMPPRLIHCQNCRHLLNQDLRRDSVVIPAFVPLKEITLAPTVAPRGFYEDCHACGRELKIQRRFVGSQVRCKFCQAGFHISEDLGPNPQRDSYYAKCPHCREKLRIGAKYLGKQVSCKHCRGELKIALADEPQLR